MQSSDLPIPVGEQQRFFYKFYPTSDPTRYTTYKINQPTRYEYFDAEANPVDNILDADTANDITETDAQTHLASYVDSGLESITEAETDVIDQDNRNFYDYGVIGSDEYKTKQVIHKLNEIWNDPGQLMADREEAKRRLEFEMDHILDYYGNYTDYIEFYT